MTEDRQRTMERAGQEPSAPKVDEATTEVDAGGEAPPRRKASADPDATTTIVTGSGVPGKPPADEPSGGTSAATGPQPTGQQGANQKPSGDGQPATPPVPPAMHANTASDSGGIPAGAPPWQRGGAGSPAQRPGSGAPQGSDPGPRGSSGPGPSGPSGTGSGSPSERTYAFSSGPATGLADEPTGYVPTVTDPVAEDRQEAAGARTTSARLRPGRAVPRRASLQVKRFDPWSVLKLALVLSVALFLVWLVAVGVLYGVLDGMGVWDQLNGTYSDLVSVNGQGDEGALISAGRVFAVAAIVGAVNIVLFTAFVTVASFIYNASADLAGGIEVTLSERD